MRFAQMRSKTHAVAVIKAAMLFLEATITATRRLKGYESMMVRDNTFKEHNTRYDDAPCKVDTASV
jgi:hypothetical protein